MKIEKEKFVALSYTLVVDGAVADQATKEAPLKFVFGTGLLLPKFEANIAGLQKGDQYSFTLTPEEGYGVVREDMIIELPKEAFMINGQIEEGLLVVGNRIPMMTQTGAQIIGIVKEIADAAVKMDFNPPMAGKTLNFSGEIVEVREANDDDYPNDCNCGCDDCHGDCEHEHGCDCGDEDCHCH